MGMSCEKGCGHRMADCPNCDTVMRRGDLSNKHGGAAYLVDRWGRVSYEVNGQPATEAQYLAALRELSA
jgi:hypothetical protein